jgi:hypothetical protein
MLSGLRISLSSKHHVLDRTAFLILVRYRDKDPDNLANDPCKSFLDQYKNYGPQAFWKLLMDLGDKFTVRQYLTQQYAPSRFVPRAFNDI